MKRLPHIRGLKTLVFTFLIGSSVSFAQIPLPGQVPDTPPQPGQVAPKTEPKTQPGANTQPEQPVESDADVSNLIRVGVRYVLVPTTVIEKSTGGYVNGLAIKDFEVYDNGKLQKIESDVSYQPLSLVLVVQANSDVEPVLPNLKHAGVLLQGLVTGATGDAALLAFDHRRRVLQDFTNDPAKLDDAMQKLTSGSSTAALIDAVAEADHMLKVHDPQNKRRRVIVLISRNIDKGSEGRLQEVARQMQFDNIIVYCIDVSKFMTSFFKKPDYPRPANGGIPAEATPNGRGNINNDTTVAQQADGNWLAAAPPIARSIRDVFKKTPAEAFTEFTGGRIYNFTGQKTLETALSEIGKELQSQYILSYSPNDKGDSGFHTIKVVVDHPGLVIRTRPGYWWGGGPQ